MNGLAIEIPRELAQHWGWFLALGIGLGLVGILGIVYSIRATVASLYFYGRVQVAAAAIEPKASYPTHGQVLHRRSLPACRTAPGMC
jgi:uncharacterized membrane protein HdeD (DUF308 family)